MNDEQQAARDAATPRILEWMESRLCSKISCHQIAEEAVKRAFDSGYDYEPPDDPEFNALLGATIEDINDKYRKEGFDAGIAARDAEDAWVAVSDRLPDNPRPIAYANYFVTLTIPSTRLYWQERAMWIYEPEGCRWECEKGSGDDQIQVVAWMPIPKYQQTEGE